MHLSNDSLGANNAEQIECIVAFVSIIVPVSTVLTLSAAGLTGFAAVNVK